MRFGVTLGAAGAGRDPRGLAETARVAEAAGWDGLFLEDYFGYQGDVGLPTWDPWISLAAAAIATTRIRIGFTVLALPRHQPWEVAAQAVTLDHLSGGRLILGVGAGDVSDPVFTATGTPADVRTRAGRLDEALEIIAGLWTGEPVTVDGNHYRVDGLRLAAAPVQRPRIPLWIGGDLLVPGVRRRLARWDGACVHKGTPPDSESPSPGDVREIRTLAGTHSRPGGFDVKVSWTGDPAEQKAFADAGATWANRWIPPGPDRETRAIIEEGPGR